MHVGVTAAYRPVNLDVTAIRTIILRSLRIPSCEVNIAIEDQRAAQLQLSVIGRRIVDADIAVDGEAIEAGAVVDIKLVAAASLIDDSVVGGIPEDEPDGETMRG